MPHCKMEDCPLTGGKYKYQGRKRHMEIGETEIGRVNTLHGSGKQFVHSHVARDLLSVYYICYFKYKIKIDLGEFDIRCLFIVSYLTPVQRKLSSK